MSLNDLIHLVLYRPHCCIYRDVDGFLAKGSQMVVDGVVFVGERDDQMVGAEAVRD